MKLYYIMGRFLGTQAEARTEAKEQGVKFVPEQDTVEVPTDKEGLINYLNRMSQSLRDQPDGDYVTGRDEFTTVVERQDPPVEEPETPARMTRRAIEDVWPNLDLEYRFHLCALTMEDARSIDWRGTTPALAPQGYGGSQPRGSRENVSSPEDDELFS